jgi:hypothetical protein
VDRTNAERQRRYIANLKAAAAQVQGSASVRQENAALRQQITALKQEQQRAMAKAARQEGLATKALKAAVTKPNGVVGFLDANLEFHEAGCPPPYPLVIPSWVPPEARPAIAEMWKDTLPDKEVRTALKRLATDKKMDDDVWKKLRNVKGVAEIVPSAIEALVRSALLRSPPQSKRREALQRYQQHLDKLWINHPHPTGGYDWPTLAGWAYDLRDVLYTLRDVLGPTGDERWSPHWRRGPLFKEARFQPFLDRADYARDPAMSTMGAAISFLHALYHCLLSIDAELRSDVKRSPQVVRWARRTSGPAALGKLAADPGAPRRFFAQIMADKMRELCGRPRHDVVAALVRVAFKVDDVTTDIVREWCRKTGK